MVLRPEGNCMGACCLYYDGPDAPTHWEHPSCVDLKGLGAVLPAGGGVGIGTAGSWLEV